MLAKCQVSEDGSRMLGMDRSRGYALETIGADFLAGAGTQVPDRELLLYGLIRLLRIVPEGARGKLVREAWGE